MELITHYLPPDFTLVDLSDFHLGSPNCAESNIVSLVNQIKQTENEFVIFKGDAIEAITPGDKRYKWNNVLYEYGTPQKQAERVIDLIWPIRDRVLVWGTGNHELKLYNINDFGSFIAKALDTYYGAYCFKIRFFNQETKKLMFKTFHTHGMGSINSNAKDDIQYDANRAAALKHKLIKSGHGDCIYMSMGHNHQLIVVPPTVDNRLYLVDDGHKIKQRYHVAGPQTRDFIPENQRWYATTGSFLKLYSEAGKELITYGEVAGYAPAALGYIRCYVENGHFIKAEKVAMVG